MEKLIELLNEYEEKGYRKIKNGKPIQLLYTYTECRLKIISKEYGFIKWLVDNDKIKDFTLCAIDKKNDFIEREIQEEYESLLMMLSIQDNPIQFLVDILK